MKQMENKIVLIAGAKGGLGSFVTGAFLDAGARVVGVSRSIADGDFAHPEFTAMPAELTNGDAAQALVDGVVSRFGRIDAAVHLVGGFAGGTPVEATEDSTAEKMFAMNYWPAFHLIRAVLPRMQRQGAGSIVAAGSRAAVEASPQIAAYAASKAALAALVRSVAGENKDRGIRANLVLPGTMDTKANREAMPDADFSKWVHPSQVASLFVFLASDAASKLSGALIPIYGQEL